MVFKRLGFFVFSFFDRAPSGKWLFCGIDKPAKTWLLGKTVVRFNATAQCDQGRQSSDGQGIGKGTLLFIPIFYCRNPKKHLLLERILVPSKRPESSALNLYRQVGKKRGSASWGLLGSFFSVAV